MKSINTLVFFNTLLLGLSILVIGVNFWLSNGLQNSEASTNYHEITKKIEASHDTEWLKEGFLLMTNQVKDINQDSIAWYREIAYLHFTFLFLVICNYYFLFKTRKELISNKSFEPDAG